VTLAILVRGLTKSLDTSDEVKLILLWHQQAQIDRTTATINPTSLSPIMKKKHVCK